MSEYFLEPKSSEGRLKVPLHFCNHATKADLKNVIGQNTSKYIKIGEKS